MRRSIKSGATTLLRVPVGDFPLPLFRRMCSDCYRRGDLQPRVRLTCRGERSVVISVGGPGIASCTRFAYTLTP